jgi:hypothetical protein
MVRGGAVATLCRKHYTDGTNENGIGTDGVS